MMDGSILFYSISFFFNRTVLFRAAVSGGGRLPNTVAVETSRRCTQQWDLWPLPQRLMGNVVLKDKNVVDGALGHKVTTDATSVSLMSGFLV